jgi:tetratricopeptide (TPR) repeat protein
MAHLSLRPQPLGIFPPPTGYLVLPPVDGAEDVCVSLLAGRLPEHMPASLRFYALALANDQQGAWRALANDPTPEAHYNRFVLRSDPEAYPHLRRQLNGDLAALLDLVAYMGGLTDSPPAVETLRGEIAACILPAHAACALARQQYDAAIAALQRAIEEVRRISPLFAAQLLDHLATVYLNANQSSAALQALRDAATLAVGGRLFDLRAYLSLRLGMLCQDQANGQRALLLEANEWFQEALRCCSVERTPDLYALAHYRLALTLLAIAPSGNGDQATRERAIQSLRESLRVYTCETHYDQWLNAQITLANALRISSAASPNEHLIEAVRLYDEVLAHRDQDHDPIGYGRVLANQGTALFHLGRFDCARDRLIRARSIFLSHRDYGAAALLEEALVEIDCRVSRTENQELRTENQEPRTKNQEPRTKNQEPRTEN